MKPLEAIKTATANGPLTLGKFQAPLSGELKAGYDADIIAIGKNPLKDISVLGDSKNVILVWKDGRLVKNTVKEYFDKEREMERIRKGEYHRDLIANRNELWNRRKSMFGS